MFKQFIHYVYPISNFLGGKMKTKQVEVLPYDKKWRIEFEKIKNIIVLSLADIIIDVEHVGSTSVEGLASNPVIDIDIVIPTYDCFNILLKKLKKLGYTYEENKSNKDMKIFTYVGNTNLMDHNLFICSRKSKELKRHLAFKAYLKENKDSLNKYNNIKLEAANLYPNNIETYIKLKSEYVKEIYKKLNLL